MDLIAKEQNVSTYTIIRVLHSTEQKKRKYYFPTVLGIDAPEGIKNSIS